MQALPKKTAVEVRAVFQRVIVLRSIGAAPVGVSVFSWLTYYFCGDNGDGSCFSSAGLPLQPKKTKKSTVQSTAAWKSFPGPRPFRLQHIANRFSATGSIDSIDSIGSTWFNTFQIFLDSRYSSDDIRWE